MDIVDAVPSAHARQNDALGDGSAVQALLCLYNVIHVAYAICDFENRFALYSTATSWVWLGFLLADGGFTLRGRGRLTDG